MANIVSPTEVVVISSFHIELDGGGGDFHVSLPYSMLSLFVNFLMQVFRAIKKILIFVGVRRFEMKF